MLHNGKESFAAATVGVERRYHNRGILLSENYVTNLHYPVCISEPPVENVGCCYVKDVIDVGSNATATLSLNGWSRIFTA